MRRNILYIAFASAVMAAAALTSCNENELDPKKAGEGKKISFSISDAGTRTEYDSDDNLQINWTEGDKVRIFCDEAEDVKNADYTVAQISKNSGKLVYNESGLAWGGDDLVHNFYAVYPASDDKIVGVDGNGIATFKVNHNQVCTVTGLANNHYSTAPDMTNAYMVASLSTAPVDEVALTFKPIMTTLEITVQGCPGTNDRTVTLTGISIINKKASYAGVSEGTLKYDVTKGEIASGNETATTETYYVGIKNGNDTHIDLKGTESVTLTAFIPPVAINAENTVTIQVHATGELNATIGGKTDKNGKVTSVNPGAKATFTLPNMPLEKSGNNWITPLDDNIYVQQLSIPGTHDSSADLTSLFSVGQTQTLSINEQWDMGIRAFDLRTAYDNTYGKMTMWHGFTYCEKSLNDVLTTITSNIKSNPGEFAILQFRHETEAPGTRKDLDKWGEIYNELNAFDKIDGGYKGIVQWKADLTIGECRGKLIILTRNDYELREKAGLITGFPECTLSNAIINGSTTYYVQDYYKYTFAERRPNDENYYGNKKIQLIQALIETTSNFKDKASLDFVNKSWALNHTSGYCASSPYGIITIELGSTTQYQYNASLVNPQIYNYIQNMTERGPLGIIFMDWVGTREASSYTVYGDLLPQTIIDNNYKYRMLRQGE